jgi:hypothetical protein
VSHRLPAWTQPGGWFVAHASDVGCGCGYGPAAFFDRNGHRMPDHHW